MTKTDHGFPWAIAAVLAVSGFWITWWLTGVWGVGYSADGVYAVEMARNMALGQGGAIVPSAHGLGATSASAPLFPFLIAVTGLLGPGFFDAPRIINSLLFGVNIFLAMRWMFRVSGRPASLWAGFLVLSCVQVVENHGKAQADPLFVTLMLVAFLLYARYRESGRALDLRGLALACGASVLASDAGVWLIAAMAVMLATGAGKDKTARLKDVVFFGLWIVLLLFIPLVMAVFPGTTMVEGGGIAPLFSLRKTGGFWNLVSGFLLPMRSGALVRAAGVVIFVAISTALTRMVLGAEGTWGPRERSAGKTIAVFCVFYAVGTIVSAGRMSDDLFVYSRVLLPLFVALLLWLALVMSGLRPGRLRILTFSLLALFVALHAMRTLQFARTWRDQGWGYASKEWSRSEVIRTISSLAEGVTVYSDDPAAVYYIARRPAVRVPSLAGSGGHLGSPREVAAALASRRAFVVMFDKAFEPGPDWKNIVAQVPLKALMKDGQAAIWGVDRAVRQETGGRPGQP